MNQEWKAPDMEYLDVRKTEEELFGTLHQKSGGGKGHDKDPKDSTSETTEEKTQ